MAHTFASNIYPGAICSGPQGCGKTWEEHPQSVPIPTPDGSCAYDQDVLGLPCFQCGKDIEEHTYRIATFFETIHNVGIGDTEEYVVITDADRGALRKYRGGPAF